MKIIFMGTPEFSVPALSALTKAGHEIVAVYTRPPRPAGRGQKEQKSAVHEAALKHNIPVFTPASLKNPEEQKRFASHKADVAVVVAYGLILPKAVLDACRCINIHASLLPRWRGAAPIQRAIMAGDSKTGITIMKMDEGLDTGDMLLWEEIKITENMNAGALHDALSALGARLVVAALDRLSTIKAVPQKGEASYAAKITKEDARIDWGRQGAEIIRHIMAFSPAPGAYFEHKGEKIKLLGAGFHAQSGLQGKPGQVDADFSIHCLGGKITPTLLQRQGRKAMPIEEFLRGVRL